MLGSLAQYLGLVDRFAEARGPAEEAVAMAIQVGARAEEANARTALGSALAFGEPDAGLAELEAAHHIAIEAGDVVVTLRAVVNRSDVLVAVGRLEEAATVALAGMGEASLRGPATSPRRCSPATPPRHCSPSAAGTRPSGSPPRRWSSPPTRPRSTCPWPRAALELGLGDLDAADAQLRTARRLIPSLITEAQRAGPLFTGLAELSLCRGDLERAREQVAEAEPWSRPTPAMPPRCTRSACASRPTGPSWPGPAAPVGLSPTTAPPARSWNASAGPPPARTAPASRTWPAGTPPPWRSGTGSRPRRPGRLGGRGHGLERLDPYRVAYARFRQAEALMAGGGDRDAATEALRRAAAITGRLGAHPLDAEVKALAQRARLRLDPDAPPATAAPTPTEQLGLTPREAEVLALVAAGRSNRQIAAALFISPKTASVHVSNILAKLGVATRSGAPPSPTASAWTGCAPAWPVKMLGTGWRSAVGGRPTKAERVTGGIGVDLEDLGRLEVVGRLQEPRAQRDCLLMRGLEVVDPQVQMDLLLWCPVRPIRGHVRREHHRAATRRRPPRCASHPPLRPCPPDPPRSRSRRPGRRRRTRRSVV